MVCELGGLTALRKIYSAYKSGLPPFHNNPRQFPDSIAIETIIEWFMKNDRHLLLVCSSDDDFRFALDQFNDIERYQTEILCFKNPNEALEYVSKQHEISPRIFANVCKRFGADLSTFVEAFSKSVSGFSFHMADPGLKFEGMALSNVRIDPPLGYLFLDDSSACVVGRYVISCRIRYGKGDSVVSRTDEKMERWEIELSPDGLAEIEGEYFLDYYLSGEQPEYPTMESGLPDSCAIYVY